MRQDQRGAASLGHGQFGGSSKEEEMKDVRSCKEEEFVACTGWAGTLDEPRVGCSAQPY